jgi:hypothetical protein
VRQLLAGAGGGKFAVRRLTNGGRNARYCIKPPTAGLLERQGRRKVEPRGRNPAPKGAPTQSKGGPAVREEEEEEEEEAEEEGQADIGSAFMRPLVASRISTTGHLWVQMAARKAVLW